MTTTYSFIHSLTPNPFATETRVFDAFFSFNRRVIFSWRVGGQPFYLTQNQSMHQSGALCSPLFLLDKEDLENRFRSLIQRSAVWNLHFQH